MDLSSILSGGKTSSLSLDEMLNVGSHAQQLKIFLSLFNKAYIDNKKLVFVKF